MNNTLEKRTQKKYYSIKEIANKYNISELRVQALIKDNTLNATLVRGELKVPIEGFPYDWMSHIFRYSISEKSNVKRSISDEIRKGVVFVVVCFAAPLIGLLVYMKIVGVGFALSENGLLIGIGVVVVSGFIAYLGYLSLFSKYSDDLPDRYF